MPKCAIGAEAFKAMLMSGNLPISRQFCVMDHFQLKMKNEEEQKKEIFPQPQLYFVTHREHACLEGMMCVRGQDCRAGGSRWVGHCTR